MTKEEFDKLDSMSNYSNNNNPCPDCGGFSTHPTPNCSCRYEAGVSEHGHIMKYHHTC